MIILTLFSDGLTAFDVAAPDTRVLLNQYSQRYRSPQLNVTMNKSICSAIISDIEKLFAPLILNNSSSKPEAEVFFFISIWNVLSLTLIFISSLFFH
jgi:hypothetical protein